MGIENLGKLEDAELRRAWPHEAHDFTPWLACNLDQLSSEVGINLKYEAQEQVIGNTGLRFDIVARNSVDDSVVLIENQLEDADAGHLGAMMAYLAGLEAHTVIWIAKGFDESYLSAIRWLNDHTTESFAFFAVQLRLVRIGDSPLAPIFKAVEKPNEWDRRMREAARQAGLSELGQFFQAFWKYYAQRYEGEVHPGWARRESEVRVEGAEVQIYRYLLNRDGVGICLNALPEDQSGGPSRAAPYLPSLRTALKEKNPQEEFDLSEWGGIELSIDSQDQSNWDRMADWLHEKTEIYKKVLRESQTPQS